jgi:DNA-binding winged helix-turn-helix (wHTH) protein
MGRTRKNDAILEKVTSTKFCYVVDYYLHDLSQLYIARILMFSLPSPRHLFENDPVTAASPLDAPPLDASLLAFAGGRRVRPPFRFGRCEVRVASREVLVDGQLRALQPRPFDLLVCLIGSRDRVCTTDQLLDEIWRQTAVQPGSLAAAITRVRKALCEGEPGIGQVIRTYPRVGYRFVAKLDGDTR